MNRNLSIYPGLLLVLLLGLVLPASAQNDSPGELPDAEIANDEGGVVLVRGEYAYSDPSMPDYGAEPIVLLGNMAKIFRGEFEFSNEYMDVNEPEILGRITSDIYRSPFSFEIRLPINPSGTLYDVDNDGEDDAGIAAYSVNFSFNGIGDPYLDDREFIYSRSYDMSNDYETLFEVNGGKILVWSPDDEQGAPSGFGEDGLLFTADDPTVRIPAGWTVIDMDSEPFTFDRSAEATVDIIESEGQALEDFSSLSYSEAFDAMIDMMRREYSFTEFKGIDWDAVSDEYRPLFEEAEADNDSLAYQRALLQFIENAVPDGHIGLNDAPAIATLFALPADIRGGLGIAVRELTDGRVIVNFVGAGSPAADEGIEVGAEILDINGETIDDAIAELPGLNPPYSSDVLKRLEQLRQVTRFEIGEDVEITYQNPGDGEPTTVTLTAIAEDASRLFSRSSIYRDATGAELPVEFDILPSGYGHVTIYSFSDDNHLTLLLWERAMEIMTGFGIPGLIVDMRSNSGGSPDISNTMLGYFVDEPTFIGTSARYYPDLDTFEFDPLYDQVIQPADPNVRYHGEVAVLISPSCFSACEFFSYALGLNDNTTIIGQYPTGGLGGGINYFFMPDNVLMQYTVERAVGADREIHIEGTGVEPEVVVPVDEKTLFSEGDPILDAAVEYLDSALRATVVDAGEIAVGDTVEGELALNTRDQYTLTVEDDVTLTITLGDETGQFDTTLTVLYEDGTIVALNDDAVTGEVFNSEIAGLDVEAGTTLIIEAGTYADSGEGVYTLTVEEAA